MLSAARAAHHPLICPQEPDRMSPLRATHHLFIGSTALALGSLAVVMVVHGGWQAGAAAVAISTGLVSLISFIVLATVSERARPTRPAWAYGTARPRVQAGPPASAPSPATEPAPAAAPLMDHSHGDRTVVV
jgi:hypothetical protein